MVGERPFPGREREMTQALAVGDKLTAKDNLFPRNRCMDFQAATHGRELHVGRSRHLRIEHAKQPPVAFLSAFRPISWSHPTRFSRGPHMVAIVATALCLFAALLPIHTYAGSSVAAVSDAQREPWDSTGPQVLAKSESDASQRYQWLFGRQPSEPAASAEGTALLEEFDREVKQARKVYLSGEVDKAILGYRSAIDRLEVLIESVPPGHSLLQEIAGRFQVFEELAKIGRAHV